MIVTLTNDEVTLAMQIAGARSRRCAQYARKTIYAKEFDEHATHIRGALGEVALAKHFAIDFDRSAAPRTGGFDLIVHGFRFDAKTTTRPDGNLLVTACYEDGAERRRDVDCYALCVIGDDLSAVSSPGWAFKDEVVRREHVRDLGHGPTYFFPRERLRRWKCDVPQPAQPERLKVPPMTDAERRAWIGAYEAIERTAWKDATL